MSFFSFIILIPMILLFLKTKELLEFILVLEISYLNILLIIMCLYWKMSSIEFINIFIFLMVLVSDASMSMLMVVLMNRNWSSDNLLISSSLNY